jgi:TPR repeat protein
MDNLGYVYINGWGVAQDYAEAHSWFDKTLAAGAEVAWNGLGVLYVNGWGVYQHYEAMKNLGELYLGGLGG